MVNRMERLELVGEKALGDEKRKRRHNLEMDNKKTGTHCDTAEDKPR